MTSIGKHVDDMNIAKHCLCRRVNTQTPRRYLHVTAILACIAALQTICLFGQPWYCLRVDLDTCPNCASIIGAVGAILDDSTEESALQKRLNLPVSQDELSEALMVDNGSSSTEYGIRDWLSIHVGLLAVAVCSEGVPVCGELGIGRAIGYIGRIQPYRDILDGVQQGRPFLLLAAMVSVSTAIMSAISSRTHARLYTATAFSTSISGFLCLVTITVVGTSYVTLHSQFPGVTLSVPWAAIVTAVAGYLSLYVGYTIYTDNHNCSGVYIYNWKYRRHNSVFDFGAENW